jgi:hypothetical protein
MFSISFLSLHCSTLRNNYISGSNTYTLQQVNQSYRIPGCPCNYRRQLTGKISYLKRLLVMICNCTTNNDKSHLSVQYSSCEEYSSQLCQQWQHEKMFQMRSSWNEKRGEESRRGKGEESDSDSKTGGRSV